MGTTLIAVGAGSKTGAGLAQAITRFAVLVALDSGATEAGTV